MGAQRPTAVLLATWATVASVVMTGLTAVLTIAFHDQLIDAWARGRTDISAVEPPAFTPVAVTMSVVLAVLVGVLLSFFRNGYDWARVVLSAVVLLIGVATCAVLRTDPPVLFLVVAVVSIAVDLTAAVALWHRDTRATTRLPPLPR
jgi:uncharacterized membrane protein YfcA